MSASVQYAPSARGKCAKCQGKIDKDELVVVIGSKRYQLDCVPADAEVETQDISGISALQKGDLEKLEKKFGPASAKQSKSAAASAPSSGGGRPKRSASVVKKQKDESEAEEEGSDAPTKKKAKKAAPAKKKAAPAPKKSKKSDSEAEEEEDEENDKGSGDDGPEESGSESKSDEKPKKKKPAAKRGGRGGGKADKPKKEPKSKFKLPADIVQKIRDAKESLEGLTVNDLKEKLAKNDQTKGGTRAELIEKVADGIAQGRIPRCPKCHGGRPKFNPANGVYACPGYGDDEGKYIRCSFKSTDLKREPWEN